MKKQIITYAVLALLSLSACTAESTTSETVESLRTEQMKNFGKAMRSLGNPENRPTEEELKGGSSELSDRRKQILIPSSLELIKSEGFTDADIESKTRGEAGAIIIWATEINIKKNAEIKEKLKL